MSSSSTTFDQAQQRWEFFQPAPSASTSTNDSPTPSPSPSGQGQDQNQDPDPIGESAEPGAGVTLKRKQERKKRLRTTSKKKQGWNLCLTRKLGSYNKEIDYEWIIATSTLSFRRVHGILQNIQWGLLGLFVTAAIILPEIRQYLVARTFTGSFVIFLMEFGSWAGLTFVLGWNNKLPVNYVSLAIMRVFLCLQLQYESILAQDRAEAAELKRKSWWCPECIYQMANFRFFFHRWAQSWGFVGLDDEFGGGKSTSVDVMDVLGRVGADSFTIPVNLALGGTFLFAGWFLTQFSNIRIDKLGNLMLTASFISTSMASFILVSSLTTDRFGSEFHLQLCKIWAPYAICTVWIFAFFLLQRQLCSGEKYWQGRRFAQVEFAWFALELLLCIVQTSVVLHYIPAIHKGFDASTAFQISIQKLLTTIIPGGLEPFGAEIRDVFVLIRSVFENYYGFLPMAMMEDGGSGI